MNRSLGLAVLALTLVAGTSPIGATAQTPTGLVFGGVPAINYSSDEGFGYGVIAELYQHGTRGLTPYEWSLRPTLFFTTEGRREIVAFFDAPHLLPGGWRINARVGTERHIATPYYGVGNASVYDDTLDDPDGPNPYYYRFGRARTGVATTLQGPTGLFSALEVVVGGAIGRVSVEPIPRGEGTTLYAEDYGPDPASWTAWAVRAGLVWDSRDRETGPTRGTWTDVLVQRVDGGSADYAFTRWTFTDRRYFSLAPGLVFAHRYLLQGTSAGAPALELFDVQTSFQPQEGLGGSKTVRGMLKNRLVGRGMLVWNAELRWRFGSFEMLGRPFHAVLSAFFDQGRVWEESVRVDEVFADLSRGYGGGLRVGMSENFVVALDVGRSTEAGLGMYIGLGYLY